MSQTDTSERFRQAWEAASDAKRFEVARALWCVYEPHWRLQVVEWLEAAARTRTGSDGGTACGSSSLQCGSGRVTER